MAYDIYLEMHYKKYLNAKLTARGSRAELSRSLGCHTAYMAQVLRGDAHFSLDQAEAANEFLGHTENEGNYFLLLVQYARAGSQRLRQRLQKQIDAARDSATLLKNRLPARDEIGEKERLAYFSHWYIAAVHALVSIAGHQSPTKIAARLRIGVAEAARAIEILVNAGALIQQSGGKLSTGKSQIHLGADSPLISKHHANWRTQALLALDRTDTENLHYSSVITISAVDRAKIRETLIEALAKVKTVVRQSPEEELCCLAMDFFLV